VGATVIDTQAAFTAFSGERPVNGLIPTWTGYRQAATSDASSFYISGGGAADAGIELLPSLTATSATPIIGQSAGQPCFYDARGVVLYGGALYATYGDLLLIQLAQVGGAVAPTTATTSWSVLPEISLGFVWTFL
jgi:hypothetical protein